MSKLLGFIILYEVNDDGFNVFCDIFWFSSSFMFLNFITCGNFWRTDYSALNRKWFFFYSIVIESIVLVVLPQVRYLFNEPYINSMLGTILFVLVLIVCNMGTQYIGIKRLVDIGITNPKWYLGINFLLLGSILLPGEIKSIIVHSINMVVLVMPRQTIKNNKSH